DHMSIWARDVGPIFVRDSQNRLGVVNFGFNNYSRDGDPTYIQTEGQVDRLTAQLLGLAVINSNLISEGGAIELNGRGTMMVTASVALKRNPGMTKEQIENEYKRVLGVKKVIWLSKGLAEDDRITGGHINEIARFADPHTILLAQVLPGDRHVNRYAEDSYLRMEENYRILLHATDLDGKPFRIIRIPMPPTLYKNTSDTGKLPIRSYLNYAVTNGAVLMQTYWKPGRSKTLRTTEDLVKKTLRSVYPGRKIIAIDAENINLWGGGIHCITMHMPAN
ncbi:MAG: agmatine deiminase family protein, partial [Bacillota bacterium]